MEALIYGLSPNAIIEKFDNAPPEKRFKRPKNWLLANKLRNDARSTPGSGICARIRNMVSIPMVTKTLRRTSGVDHT